MSKIDEKIAALAEAVRMYERVRDQLADAENQRNIADGVLSTRIKQEDYFRHELERAELRMRTLAKEI